MSQQYARTVTAALAETKSKFDLAAALALDVPERTQGAGAIADGEMKVEDQLEAARLAVVSAGGESRSTGTLRDYRLTGLWVQESGGSTTFRWVPGLSFSAHNEARKAGLSYEVWSASPTRTDLSRHIGGRKGTDGDVKIADVLAMPQEDLDRLTKELQVKVDADAAHRASVAAAETARKDAETKAAREAAEAKRLADKAAKDAAEAARQEERAAAAARAKEAAEVVAASKKVDAAEMARQAEIARKAQFERDQAKAEQLAAKHGRATAANVFPANPTVKDYVVTDREVELAMREDGVHAEHFATYKAAYLAAHVERWNELVAAYAAKQAEQASLAAAAARKAAKDAEERDEESVAWLESRASVLPSALKNRLIEVVAPSYN